MTKDNDNRDRSAEPAKTRRPARDERRAEALRTNLRRRKAQAQGRALRCGPAPAKD